MPRLATPREAKEFLVAEIVRQAQQGKVELSEVERKMLYFSESGWTLPDIREVNEAFDRDYDMPEYEAKIARLIWAARTDVGKDPQRAQDWPGALSVLGDEDHYLGVIAARPDATPRSSGDLLKLWVTGLAIVVVFVLIVFAVNVKW